MGPIQYVVNFEQWQQKCQNSKCPSERERKPNNSVKSIYCLFTSYFIYECFALFSVTMHLNLFHNKMLHCIVQSPSPESVAVMNNFYIYTLYNKNICIHSHTQALWCCILFDFDFFFFRLISERNRDGSKWIHFTK